MNIFGIMRTLIFLVMFSSVLFFTGFESSFAQETIENLKVAFIGDQGVNDNAALVLKLILSEGSDMVLHQGDFDYLDDPDLWDAQINNILGSDFPYFASIGNHDKLEWNGYQEKLQNRLDKIPNVQCSGDLGVKSSCNFNGLFFILSGVGIVGSDHDEYIKKQLDENNSIWSICSWHKNMKLMQVGGKHDETGWHVYEECREGGAIIATGHEHSYSRTLTLSDIDSQIIYSDNPDILQVGSGYTFVFVNGLGGKSIRDTEDNLEKNPWWAKYSTRDNGADYGALFCTFNVEMNPNKALCYFKDISGNIIDEFTVMNSVDDSSLSWPDWLFKVQLWLDDDLISDESFEEILDYLFEKQIIFSKSF
jgi:hypothetical protein